MFANIGGLIKKLLSLFFVGADSTIKAIKSLYCVGEDGRIHKISLEEAASALKAYFYSATGEENGGHVTNQDEIYAYSNNGSVVMIYYLANIPSDFERPSDNMWTITANLHVVNSDIESTNASNKGFCILNGTMIGTSVRNGVTPVTVTKRISATTTNFTVGIGASKRWSSSAPSESWLTDVKANGVPIKFYEE